MYIYIARSHRIVILASSPWSTHSAASSAPSPSSLAWKLARRPALCLGTERTTATTDARTRAMTCRPPWPATPTLVASYRMGTRARATIRRVSSAKRLTALENATNTTGLADMTVSESSMGFREGRGHLVHLIGHLSGPGRSFKLSTHYSVYTLF
jgi:hypothetical protein